MKKLVLLSLLLSVSAAARAQFTIPTTEPEKMQVIIPVDSLRSATFNNEYFSRARWQAERRALRKERNTVELNANLAATQTQFVNWQGGGENTFSARSTVYFFHRYKRNVFNFEYRIDARYGMNYIDDKLFKNEDEFKINAISSWKMQRNWSYAASTNLRSQFSVGRKSRTDDTKVSNFMAPGFFDIAVGFNYKKDKSPWNITLSPIGGNITTVLDDDLRKRGINGVPKGDKTKGQLGPSVRIFFDREFGKTKALRYRANLYSFSNIKTAPTVLFENTVDIKATKYLTTTLYGRLYYDKYSGTTEPQYNYSVSVGLSYRFKNK